jgi:hypothetical protein
MRGRGSSSSSSSERWRGASRSGGNRTETAKTLNINRQLLYAKLERYELASLEDANNDGASNIGPSTP